MCVFFIIISMFEDFKIYIFNFTIFFDKIFPKKKDYDLDVLFNTPKFYSNEIHPMYLNSYKSSQPVLHFILNP